MIALCRPFKSHTGRRGGSMENQGKPLSAPFSGEGNTASWPSANGAGPVKKVTVPVKKVISCVTTLAMAAAIAFMLLTDRGEAQKGKNEADPISANAQQMIDEGRQTFRF